MKAVTEVS